MCPYGSLQGLCGFAAALHVLSGILGGSMGLRVPMGPLSMGPLLHLYGSWVGFLWLLLGSCCVWGEMKGRCLRPLTPGPSPRPPPAVPRRRRRAVPAQFRSVAAGGAAERRAPRNGRSEIAAALRRAARGRLRVQRAALEAGHGVATPSLRRSSTWPRPHLRCFSAWGRGLDLIPPTMGVALLKGAWFVLATPLPSRHVLG